MGASAWYPARRRAALGAIVAGLVIRSQRTNAQPSGAARAAGHVVLLGDSVLDNAGYLRGSGPDIVAHLRQQLPNGWQATLLAKGGSVAADVADQLGRLPPGTSHLVISAGGNDAGRRESMLNEPARSVADGLARIAAVRESFGRDYRAMLDAALGRGLPVAVCTIYDPRFPEARRRQVALVALAAFNDIITREAFVRGIPLIDLRLVCGRDEDFAGPTGPSVQGGGKIAAEITRFVTEHGFARNRPEVFVGNPPGG